MENVVPTQITSEYEYERLMALMNWLTEDGAIFPGHPLHWVFAFGADLVFAYEQRDCGVPG
jgi:hypothetical protein